MIETFVKLFHTQTSTVLLCSE